MTHKEAQAFYPSVFSAVHYGSKITVEIDRSDLDLDEVMDAFQTLITGMGYHQDAFKNWVLNRADEYREEDGNPIYPKTDEPEFDSAGFRHEDNFSSHYVTNEEADEDAKLHMKTSFPMVDPFTTEEAEYNYRVKGETPESDYFAAMVQDEQRYEDSLRGKRGAITQRLLDYVASKGAVTYGELHEYYKSITGSNSFSHVLKALRIPYKNRPTQRYIDKEGCRYSDAKYIVKLANPSNWVVVDDYDND